MNFSGRCSSQASPGAGRACTVGERLAATNALLGVVPYLDGGLFERHPIEELHGEAICIPDAAFERLFDFFHGYHWHLDERPLREDDEINPDVLGYIFEKYVNQKQMGAYYTKEDITEYIAKNTVIPFLLDATAEKCPGDWARFSGTCCVTALTPTFTRPSAGAFSVTRATCCQSPVGVRPAS